MTILSNTTSLPSIIIALPPPTQTPCPPNKKNSEQMFFRFWMHAAFMGFCPWKCFPSHVLLKEWNGETPEGVGKPHFFLAKPIQKGWRCEDSPMPMKVRAV